MSPVRARASALSEENPLDKPEHTALSQTPALGRLLSRLHQRLTRQVWLFGIGTLLGVISLWLTFAFFADWALRVPRGVRIFHLLVLIALPIWTLSRFLLRPLRRRPDRAGLAILLERHQPQHELLVSAVQLQATAVPLGAPELVRQVYSEADARAAQLDLSGVLEEQPPRRRFILGTSCAGVLALAALASPLYTGIFLRRLVGGSASWPQRTQLELTVPIVEDRARVLASAERIDVKIARGSDVPVVVRASGKIPREVTLHFADDSELVLNHGSDGIFRAMLRSRQEDCSFHATGGDDTDGLPRVSIEVLEAPDVAGLAVRIEPPAYTGRSPRTEFDRDVEVLAGSALAITMLPTPPEARGKVRILPEDRLINLVPRPFPARDEEHLVAEGPEGARELQGLGFALQVSESLRFRFELEDDSGLSNPDPGLFAVHVIEDRRPEVEVISPGRTELDTVVGGALALRGRAADDFGIRSMSWNVFAVSEGEQAARVHALDFQRLDPGEETRPGTLRHAVLAGTRLEVLDLAGGQAGVTEGEQYLIEVQARDNRPGEDGAATGRSGYVRVRVVSPEEFVRRVQDRLARLRLRVSELEVLQRQKARLTRELIESFESDAPDLAADAGQLNSVLTGQRRVDGDSEALVRELTSITEGILYSRLDEKAAARLEQMDAALSRASERSFQVDIWRDLVLSWRAGSAGTGLAAQLIGLLDLGMAISYEDCRPASDALDRAASAVDLAGIHAALVEASGDQERSLVHIEELLGRLAEWDNFQSILSLTRDILSRQKALMERTKQQAREK